MNNVEQEIIHILEDNFYIQKGTLKSDTNLETVITDSMDFVELVAVLTVKYKISVDPESVRPIRTVRDIAKFIKQSAPEATETLLGF